jgi:hypothetical protein
MEAVQIYGPFCTGTNLIWKIIKENVKNVKLTRVGSTHLWKHTIDIESLKDTVIKNPKSIFICMYKPPYHWIESIKKASYDITINEENLMGSCSMQGKEYKNLIEMYNIYYLNYKNLIENYKNVICMNYYELLDIDNIRKYINNKLKPFDLTLKKDDNIKEILNKPSKNHGNSVKNFSQALNKKNILDEKLKESDIKHLLDKEVDKAIHEFFNSR